MPEVRLPDQEAREEVVAASGVNVAVEASAGTGKTHLLIRRVRSLATRGDDPIPLRNLAVVTFTDAAAAELRMRIRRSLRELGGEQRAALLRDMPSAVVSTIHGFASRVLRDYFHLAGVSPTFTVSKSAISPTELSRLWDAHLSSVPAETLLRCADLLETPDSLPNLARELSDLPWLKWPDSFLDPADRRLTARGAWAAMCRETLAAMDGAGDSDTLACSLREVLPRVAGALDDGAPLTEIACTCAGIRSGRASNRAWPSKEARDAAASFRDSLKRDMPGLLLYPQLEELLGPFVEKLASAREGSRSRLTYDDLLNRCTGALAPGSALLAEAGARFIHVLIDEFQDTSPDQVALFRSLLGGGRIPQGRMTIVGDPKQSIYGWRHADIRMYRDMLEELSGDGETLRRTITVSNRSTRAIVDFVNSFGYELFSGPGPGEEPYSCSYSPLVPRDDALEGDPVCVLISPEGLGAEDRARFEAAWLADFLKEQQVARKGLRGWALLFRSMTHVDIFRDALEDAGIPWRFDSARDFRKRPETADFRNLMECVGVPTDRKALLSVLRSPFFGVPDDDITAAIEAGLEGFSLVPAGAPPSVAQACGALAALREASLAMPPAELLQTFLLELPFVASLVAEGYETERRLADIQYLFGLCLSGEAGSTPDLMEALADAPEAEEALEDPSPPSDSNGVILGTIHKAKGLGYDHVVFVSTGSGGGRRGTLRLDERSGRAAVKVGAGRSTPLWRDLEGLYAVRDRAESRRLAYVAVTRAKETLTVLAGNQSRSSDIARAVYRSVCAAAEADSRIELREMPEVSPPASRERRPVVLPSSPSPASLPQPKSVPIPGRGSQERFRMGLAVHSLLEKIDMSDPEGWLDRNLPRSLLPRGVDRVEARRLALRFFRLDLPFPPGRALIRREYPYFSRRPDGGIQERYVDLLADWEGMLFALDYKTDAAEGMDAALAEYSEKQELYGRDLSRAAGRAVTVMLAFLDPGRLVAVGTFSP